MQFLSLVLLIPLVSVGLCEQPQQQQQDVQLVKLQGLVPIKIKRTFRSLNPFSPVVRSGSLRSYRNYPSAAGMASLSDYSPQIQQRAPRWPYAYYGNYQLPLYPNLPSTVRRSYRPVFRGSLSPISSFSDGIFRNDEAENNDQDVSSEQIGRLRFLGWLFGRPPMSPYPDYSVLEQAAGISYGSRLPSVGYPRPHSPIVVEECVELLDPYTDHIYEECEDVPMYH